MRWGGVTGSIEPRSGVTKPVGRSQAHAVGFRLSGERRRLGKPRSEPSGDFIPDPTKRIQPIVIGAGRLRGVVQTPVNPLGRFGKHRTPLTGAVADSDHVVPGSLRERVEGLGGVSREIDPDLAHDLNRERVNAARFRAGAGHVNTSARHCTEQRLGHLAPG